MPWYVEAMKSLDSIRELCPSSYEFEAAEQFIKTPRFLDPNIKVWFSLDCQSRLCVTLDKNGKKSYFTWVGDRFVILGFHGEEIDE